ncbi:hypothetical protein [Falsiroseomonas sp.]|jgi:hypothetical protein|uniref:hypothetical protein n=1 Tax=Falsiroseomonas sp. TaxID=2870721 RepID=UPI003F6F929A
MLFSQAEFPDPDHPTHRLVAAQKRRMRDTMVGLVKQAGIDEPEMVADTLATLFDGAWATLPYRGGDRAAEILSNAAACALKDAPGRG